MWCHRPGMSVKRRSRIFASWVFANSITFFTLASASAMDTPYREKFPCEMERTINETPASGQAATIGRVVRNRESLKPVDDAGNSIVLIAGITRLYTGTDKALTTEDTEAHGGKTFSFSSVELCVLCG